MSNTTCITAIKATTHITSTYTVDKLYIHANIEQPQRIIEKPIKWYDMGRVITALDVLVNSTVAAKERNDHKVCATLIGEERWYIVDGLDVVYNVYHIEN